MTIVTFAAPDGPSPAEIERVARLLCAAERLDPDALIYSGAPLTYRHGYIPTTAPVAAWTTYKADAATAIAAVKAQP